MSSSPWSRRSGRSRFPVAAAAGQCRTPRPARLGRAHLSVAAEDGRLILAGIGVPRPEIGDLAHPAAHPATGAGVVERHDRVRALARAERRITALPVPGRVESWHPKGYMRGWRDTRAGARTRAHRLRRRHDRSRRDVLNPDSGCHQQRDPEEAGLHNKETGTRVGGYGERVSAVCDRRVPLEQAFTMAELSRSPGSYGASAE